jgi:energy-coupling factor transport system ATP-binding protein
MPDVIPFVMQNPEAGLFGETPMEELVFTLEQQCMKSELIMDKARAALCRVGLEHCMDLRINELSGGQKQLVSIAACIATESPLLLFDEATSMLDPWSRQEVLKAVKVCHREGAAVIWLTQHMEEAAMGERVIVLENGAIVFDSNPVDFFYGETSNSVNGNLDLIVTLETPCHHFGFKAPYPVQIAQELLKLGKPMAQLPLTKEQLAEQVCYAE